MSFAISVVIPTYQPRRDYLSRVLEALRAQSLAVKEWELLLVNNAGTKDLLANYDVSWHENIREVPESRLGLTWARRRGILEANGELLVFIDDDNIVDSNFLLGAQSCFLNKPDLFVAGGKIVPDYEEVPQKWVLDFLPCLAVRDHGEQELFAGPIRFQNNAELYFPEFAPIGAGMVMTKKFGLRYVQWLEDSTTVIVDRQGASLSSGGDNEIVLLALSEGGQIAYLPSLSMQHIIPRERVSLDYLARVNYASSKSWIAVLSKFKICPWSAIPAWTLWMRKLRSYFAFRAWKGKASYVRWRGACGMFDALADLPGEL